MALFRHVHVFFNIVHVAFGRHSTLQLPDVAVFCPISFVAAQAVTSLHASNLCPKSALGAEAGPLPPQLDEKCWNSNRQLILDTWDVVNVVPMN